MAGGSDDDFARARPVLEGVAASLVHLGPVGAGQVTKMVNQVCVLTNFVVLAEALNLAERGGVDTGRLLAAVGPGYAGSNLMRARSAEGRGGKEGVSKGRARGSPDH